MHSHHSEIQSQEIPGYKTVVAGKSSQHPLCSRTAQIIRAERERKGMSMNQLAESAGISQQMVSYVERGMKTPTLDCLGRIADGLGVPVWKILRRAEEL